MPLKTITEFIISIITRTYSIKKVLKKYKNTNKNKNLS